MTFDFNTSGVTPIRAASAIPWCRDKGGTTVAVGGDGTDTSAPLAVLSRILTTNKENYANRQTIPVSTGTGPGVIALAPRRERAVTGNFLDGYITEGALTCRWCPTDAWYLMTDARLSAVLFRGGL